MRVGQYIAGLFRIAKEVWDRSEKVGALLAIAGALIGALIATIALGIAAPIHLHDWRSFAEMAIPLWGVFVLLFVAPYWLWREAQENVEKYEKEAKPKLKVSEFFSIEPKGATGAEVVARELRLKIYNNSSSVIKNCHVRMQSFVNVNGNESDVLGIRFKLTTDQPHIIQDYDHVQAFDLPPHTEENISICGTNKNVLGDVVIMLYAARAKGSQGIRNSIPYSFFPHFLTLHIAADNLVRPVERKYRLSIDSEGVFQAEREHG